MIKQQIENKKRGIEPVQFNKNPRIGIDTPSSSAMDKLDKSSDMSNMSSEDLRGIINKEREQFDKKQKLQTNEKIKTNQKSRISTAKSSQIDSSSGGERSLNTTPSTQR